MRLEAPLAHEGDILDFVTDLRQSVSALLRPRECVIERLAADAPAAPGARLRAACAIDWITIRERRS